MIPPEQDGAFVAQMEKVLEVYKRPYDPQHPVVCMDESPRQLIGEVEGPIPAKPGRHERMDSEYVRKGICEVFMANEPLAGKRMAKVTERRTAVDWAHFAEDISLLYPAAERITLVMDNLNTHGPGSLYEAFPPEKAKAIWDRFDFVHTPRHGSWLNMAEIELGTLARQCLNRRISDIAEMRSEVEVWQKNRNNLNAKINWRLTTTDARIKLKRLYPTLDA